MFSYSNDNYNDTLSWKVTTISNQHVLSIRWITVVVLFSIKRAVKGTLTAMKAYFNYLLFNGAMHHCLGAMRNFQS